MLNLNANFPLRDLGFSNALGLDSLPRHRWYFVKEGFSPQLVENAIQIEGVKKGQTLLEPFSGGGTVALVGASAGLNVKALEVNPFLRFLSSAKLKNASVESFKSLCSEVERVIRRPKISPLEGFSTFTKGNRWERWLFPTEVLRGFEAGRQLLTPASTPPRALAKLALIAAAMDCCNAARDGKCLRYRSEWATEEASLHDLQIRFRARVEAMQEDLSAHQLPHTLSSVAGGDTRVLLQDMTQKFDLCVTSPPYLNSFDYSDVYRPELFLGGFVESNKDLMKVRLSCVRSHVQASWDAPKRSEFGSLYRDCIDRINERSDALWDQRIPKMVQAYFEDMEKILRQMRHRANPNAAVWLVVSTSAYAGVEVPVDLILAEIGQRVGWYLREVGVLRYLRSSSQHVKHVQDETRKSVPLRESVVILDANRKAVERTKTVTHVSSRG